MKEETLALISVLMIFLIMGAGVVMKVREDREITVEAVDMRYDSQSYPGRTVYPVYDNFDVCDLPECAESKIVGLGGEE